MRTTNQLLNAIKARHQIGSDYRLAQVLECQKSAIYGYRAGRSRLDESMCIKVAELLQEPAGAILAEVAAERAKRPEVKRAWETAARAAAAGVGALMLFVIFGLDAGESQTSLAGLFALVNTHYTNPTLLFALTFALAACCCALTTWNDRRHQPARRNSLQPQ